MKIRVAYAEHEKDKEQLLEAAVRQLFPSAAVKETAPKDGFRHMVLTVPMLRNVEPKQHKPD